MTQETHFGRVLVVDDENSLRKVLSDLLRRRGYEAEAVATGTEAIELVRANQHDVAIIDLRLAYMSGLDVLREIRAVSPRTACIILTGKPSQESAIQAVNLGAFSYLKKPFKVDELLGTIQSALETRGSVDSPVSLDEALGCEIADALRDCRACLRNIRNLASSLERADSLDGARRFGGVLLSETAAGIRMLDDIIAKF